MPARQAVPSTMQAVMVQAGVMALAAQPVPQPGPGQVLIKVAAAGVNRADIYQRLGKYPAPPGASPILGLEVAGEIAALGVGVTAWQIGDFACALLPGGGYAEYAVAEAALCLPIPMGVSVQAAASLPEAAFTTYANLIDTARAQAGDWVLIHGGSSGIGSFAIQLLKAMGAQVITTVGSAAKAEFCRALGADMVVNYKETDFAAAVLKATHNHGIDIILDMIGQEYFTRHVQILAPLGRLVTIAAPSGKDVSLDLLAIMQKRLVITGSTLRSRSLAEKTELAFAVQQTVWPLLADGQIKPVICQVFPLSQAAQAHELMESSQHKGKILLSTEPPV